MEGDWQRTHDEIGAAFSSGEVGQADSATLQKWLQNICNGIVLNSVAQHQEIARCLTINHIQQARTIEKLERTIKALNEENGKTQRAVTWLTVVAVIAGIAQVFTAIVIYWLSRP